MSGYIRTFTGKAFYPKAPNAYDIDINDIAHALSMACRWGGHVKRFYSVAEHSVHVSNHCPLGYELWGLLHDATEAYLVDLPRPIKQMLPDYKVIEDGLMVAIEDRFGLEHAAHMPPSVKVIDNRILNDERAQLMNSPTLADVNTYTDGDQAPLGIELPCWIPARAELEFLWAFDRLTR